MKFSKFVGASLLALSLSIPTVLPASAQTTTSPGGTTVETDRNARTEYRTEDNDFDWGWLGLLGLIGLAGLAKKREEPVRYREPNEVGTGTPGPRY